MRINHLTLKNYRNYDKLDIDLSPGVNILVGNNAQGKSNILESIFVLALTKSYMNIKDYNLIEDGKEFTSICGMCADNNNSFSLDVIISQNSKKIKKNSNEVKKYSDYISSFKVLIFSPYNVNFVKDGPSFRRKSINMVISQISSHYMRLLQKYNIVLKKRNQYLKSVNYLNDSDKLYLDVLNDNYCSMAVDIALLRSDFIEKVNSVLANIYFEITGYDGLILKYVSNVPLDNKDKVYCIDKMKDNLLKNFEREKNYGATLLGIHRDDFIFFLGDKELSIYGSQGQIRAAILSLKLAELKIFKDYDGDYPVLLLDDIFSELDVDKRNRLIKYMLDDVQTIITTTDVDLIDEYLLERSKIFTIDDGKIIKVNDGRREKFYE